MPSRWFDADTLLLNSRIPLEIFLPSSDRNQIHLLDTQDHNGLNTGVLLIRRDPWPSSFPIKVLGLAVYHPDVDLDARPDQQVMRIIFNETEVAGHVVYRPRTWYNAYQRTGDLGWEGKAGDLLVHFPGLEDGRAEKMGKWLKIIRVEGRAREYAVPLQQTVYTEHVERFWEVMKGQKR